MSWDVEYTDEFEAWWDGLDEDDQERITAAVETLEEHGPNLKRPLVGERSTSGNCATKDSSDGSQELQDPQQSGAR